MPVPDYQTMMVPLLSFLGDKKEHSFSEAVEHISKVFNLTDAERRKLLPSGNEAIVHNRVGWARTYMGKAGFLESTRRGYVRISQRGLEVLKENPKYINVKYLERFPEFVRFRAIRKEKKEEKGQTSILSSLDPKEQLESAYQKIKEKLSHDLLAEVMKASDSFFEKLVVKLIVKMGYGGSVKDAGQAIGRTGDGGVDGVINEDKLGLDKVYIQAKKWTGNVSRPKIQEFIGALHERQASKGIFITTSGFTKEAEDCARSVPTPKVVLIDGEKLIEYMIENDVGVAIDESYEIKRVDLDFFTEE